MPVLRSGVFPPGGTHRLYGRRDARHYAAWRGLGVFKQTLNIDSQFIGSVKKKVVPLPGSLLTLTSPPCA